MWSDREVGRWLDYYVDRAEERIYKLLQRAGDCLLYTSPSPRDGLLARMPSSA